MNGADISEHQGNPNRPHDASFPPEWFAQWDFVIIRAHSGHRPDHRFANNWPAARNRTLRGVYGFLQSDEDPARQAREILSLVGNDQPELGYWCDAECIDPGHNTVEQCLEFLGVLARAGKFAGFYSFVPYLKDVLGNDARLRAWPLWIAGYGMNDGQRHRLDPVPPWTHVIHQFTSRGGPGGSGLDLNHAETLEWAGGSRRPEVHDMFVAVGRTVFGVSVAFLVSGGRVLKTFDGPEGAFGIPKSALDWKSGAGRDAVPFIFVDPDTVTKFTEPWPK